jgi:hypothetical protein
MLRIPTGQSQRSDQVVVSPSLKGPVLVMPFFTNVNLIVKQFLDHRVNFFRTSGKHHPPSSNNATTVEAICVFGSLIRMGWSLVGMAMFGQHPYDKSSDDSFYFSICNKRVHYHQNLSGKVTCDIHLNRLQSNMLAGDETYDQWREKEG